MYMLYICIYEYIHICMYIYIMYTHMHIHTYIHTFELASKMLNDLSLSHFILGTSWDTKKVLQLQRPSTRVSVGPYGYGVYGFPWGNPLTDLSFGKLFSCMAWQPSSPMANRCSQRKKY